MTITSTDVHNIDAYVSNTHVSRASSASAVASAAPAAAGGSAGRGSSCAGKLFNEKQGCMHMLLCQSLSGYMQYKDMRGNLHSDLNINCCDHNK